ncbi:MAG TPA: hypothetical protein VG815_20495 [Chloroflexota bacterium]|nr:hypothetical protein [Chloroflexota bacterium]
MTRSSTSLAKRIEPLTRTLAEQMAADLQYVASCAGLDTAYEAGYLPDGRDAVRTPRAAWMRTQGQVRYALRRIASRAISRGQLTIVNSSTGRTAAITHAKHDMFFVEVRDERGQVIHFDPYSPSVSEALRVAREMTASDWLSWAALAQTRKRTVSLPNG